MRVQGLIRPVLGGWLDARTECWECFPKAAYTQAETRLARGDVLVLYTDGVIEARNDVTLFCNRYFEDDATLAVVIAR